MPRYEYETIRWFAHDLSLSMPVGVRPLSFEEGQDVLSRMGREGWELTTSVITNHAPGYQYMVSTLKRELVDDGLMESIEIDDGIEVKPASKKK